MTNYDSFSLCHLSDIFFRNARRRERINLIRLFSEAKGCYECVGIFDRQLGGKAYKATACHEDLYGGSERVLLPENFEELELIWCVLAYLLLEIFCQNGNKIIM